MAQHQQRPFEEMLRLGCLAYEPYHYHLVHQQMGAEGLLEALPALAEASEQAEDFEPVVMPGKPLSDILLEARR